MATCGIIVPDELDERFAGLARMKGESKESLILAALEEWLEDQEDAARADEVMRGVRSGAVKILSSEEVSKRLGMEN